jgi:hypothetical protein
MPENCTTNSEQFNLAGRSLSKPEIYLFFLFLRVMLTFLNPIEIISVQCLKLIH